MADTIILYYSYTGTTKERAQALAKRREADLFELEYVQPPGKVQAYVAGSLSAMRGRPAEIKPIMADLAKYETIVLMAPVWAGWPAPPLNNMVEVLPEGKKVEVWLVSGGGSSRAKVKLATQLLEKGCEMTRYVDVGPQFNLDYYNEQ
ncbi:NAD(P)H-dependent oxidoreductase [Ruminococcaceae bacterium OttesenSCG-928-I18]|nr:NAD(P)H-dependent oxidoreductase [Ruminococcaceae bacterium OttesenSCG-928-I18]